MKFSAIIAICKISGVDNVSWLDFEGIPFQDLSNLYEEIEFELIDSIKERNLYLGGLYKISGKVVYDKEVGDHKINLDTITIGLRI